MKACLAEGFPFALGIDLYESFYSTSTEKTGKVTIPQDTEGYIGGHAVCCIGYNDKKKHFIIRNSWGSDWGKNGYCFIPYDYILNPDLADSFWMMRLVE
jgi:C1A family cysteine protease